MALLPPGPAKKPKTMAQSLLDKYNVPVPRYTSYPTVPYWQKEPPGQADWEARVLASFARDRAISLYLHLPFCESLCTYCGCNKRITKNHAVEQPYIRSLLAEWSLYTQLLPERPLLRELHLGGGTPTFFQPDSLRELLEGIFAQAEISPEPAFSVEVHPGTTTREHLAALADLGFRRISIGIQDVASEILAIINRRQTMEEVRRCTRWARELGYESVNFDLIFGLPLQTPDHIRRTMAEVEALRPERIAFYSYAHVPWISPSQRAYSEADLPGGAEKRALYELGRELLEAQGYVEIGMDHFALPGDELYSALEAGRLHRNFMGYTPRFTPLCLALGASSISDSWTAFVQNEKRIETYQQRVAAGELPLSKGHLLSETDQILRRHILDIMCNYETRWGAEHLQCAALFDGLDRMEDLVLDGLVELEPSGLRVTERGKPFVRNIALALDAPYWAGRPQGQVFSQAV